MSANVDLELKKAFQDLQVQMVETRNRVKQIDVQMSALKRSSQHSKLTINEVNGLPQNTNLFEAIGRMFVKRDKQSINQLLEERIESNEQKCKELEQNKEYTEKKDKESRDNLRELINHKKLNQ